jgi:hypothetical protein
MTRFSVSYPFIFPQYKRNLYSDGERTHRYLRRQVMTNNPIPTPPSEPLWVLPALYALSLGLFVPGILRATLPTPAAKGPAQ